MDPHNKNESFWVKVSEITRQTRQTRRQTHGQTDRRMHTDRERETTERINTAAFEGHGNNQQHCRRSNIGVKVA